MIRDLIEYLGSMQVRKMALASSPKKTEFEHLLKSDLFEIIITKDYLENIKPNPQPYLIALTIKSSRGKRLYIVFEDFKKYGQLQLIRIFTNYSNLFFKNRHSN